MSISLSISHSNNSPPSSSSMTNAQCQLSPDDICLQGVIGQGGFGIVRRGMCRRHTPVAVKVVTQQDEASRRKILNEVALLNTLRHPNVCLFLGALEWSKSGADHGKIMLVSELLKTDLDTLIFEASKTNNVPPLATRMEWALQAAIGVEFLHGNQPPVIHCDLKLANLLTSENGVVKVCDFGLSRFAHSQEKSDDEPHGTPAYMAPEVWTRGEQSTQVDAFAFGICLWELATCEKAGKSFNSKEEYKKFILDGGRPTLSEKLPSSLRSLITSCWAQAPSDRPAFSEIVTKLSQVIEDSKQLQFEETVGDLEGARVWQIASPKKEPSVDIWRFLETLMTVLNVTQTEQIMTKLEFLLYLLTHSQESENIVKLDRWAEVLGWFGPLELPFRAGGFLDRIEALLCQEWFHNFITAQQADKALGGKEPGTFLFRFSGSTFGGFCMSLVMPTKEIVHRVVRRQRNKFVLGGREYDSVTDIVANDHLHWGLLHPCSETFRTHLLRNKLLNRAAGYLADDGLGSSLPITVDNLSLK